VLLWRDGWSSVPGLLPPFPVYLKRALKEAWSSGSPLLVGLHTPNVMSYQESRRDRKNKHTFFSQKKIRFSVEHLLE
jgi:hypothetical protein